LPFELPERTIPLEIPTLLGCVFLLTTLLQPGVCFRYLPGGFISFSVFFAVLVISSLYNGFVYPVELINDFVRFVMLLVLFWTGVNVMRDQRIATAAILWFAIAALLRALFQIGGVGVTSTVTGRLTVFGQNENYSAVIMVVGLLILVGVTYGRSRSVITPRLLIWPAVAALGFAVVHTGSRGAMAALVSGLFWFLFAGTSLRHKLTNASMAIVAFLVVAGIAYNTPMMKERWTRAFQRGDMAKREEIFPTFWEMFLEKPAIGWGHIMNNKEGGRRLRLKGWRAIGAHNVPLDVLTSTGLTGALPFGVFVWMLMSVAWKARHGPHGYLPFAVLFCVLIGNLTGSWLQSKLLWLSITYAVSCGHHVLSKRARPAARPRAAYFSPRASTGYGATIEAGC
jgi:O-antigen ligase